MLALEAALDARLVQRTSRRFVVTDVGHEVYQHAAAMLAEADAADRQFADGRRAPLLGVPVAIKDDIDLAGQETRFGCPGGFAPRANDCEAVRRLRGAGAVIVGKTNTPELGQWPFTEGPAFGITRNPWSLDHTPGGSSGGAAAAVAGGLVPGALGSDGAGSVRIPAAWTGLVGIKPQRDRVPMAPHDGAWYGLSVNGPIARTVADAALFLDVTTAPGGGFVAAAARAPGRLRIALSTKAPPPLITRVGTAQRRAVRDAGALLGELGHDVVVRDPDYPPSAIPTNFLPRYLRGVRDEMAMMPEPQRLEARTRETARLGGLFSDRRIAAALAAEDGIRARVLSIFDDVDVVVTPGTALGPSRIGAYQRRGAVATLLLVGARVPFQEIFNVTGQPAAVVPWGLDGDGLPLSIQLVGRPSDEATLLSLSAQIEQARPWSQRRPPVG